MQDQIFALLTQKEARKKIGKIKAQPLAYGAPWFDNSVTMPAK